MAELGSEAARLIRGGARELGIELSGTQVRRLAEFVDLIQVWSRRFRLVGTRDIRGQINKHILDSLVPGAVLPSTGSLLDVGTGAGFPGIPLSIGRPRLWVTLVDSRRVRANFVREAARQLGLKNIRVVEARIESLMNDPAMRGSFDGTISRAWAELPRFLEISAGLLRPGGLAVSMKGPTVESEIARLRDVTPEFTLAKRLDYVLPEGRERRVLLAFVRS